MNTLPQSRPDLTRTLIQIVLSNPDLSAVLKKVPALGLPNWYIGAGCIAQTSTFAEPVTAAAAY